jgi:hypothetical protein
MRRLLAFCLISTSLALGGVAGLGPAAAVAAAGGGSSSGASGSSSGASGSSSGASGSSSGASGSSSGATDGVTTPSLSLTNAAQNATPTTTTATVPVTTTTGSNGVSSTDAVLIAVVAVLLLGGIAFYVWRDSRGLAKSIGHHARDDTAYAGAHAGSKAARKSRKLKPAERKRRKRGRAR